MERTLRAHILSLENHVRALTERAADPTCTPEERNRFQAEILIAEQALASYRAAYEMEQSIASGETAMKDTRISPNRF